MLAVRIVHAFGEYAIGDIITDSAEVARVLASAQAQHVVKVSVPAPKPAADPAKA